MSPTGPYDTGLDPCPAPDLGRGLYALPETGLGAPPRRHRQE